MPEPDRVAGLLALPGVAVAVDQARQACTELRWHEALRRRVPEVAAESRIRGAWASAALAGAEIPVDRVREFVVGARPWPDPPDPVARVLRAVVLATLETEHLGQVVRTAPRQALARLHVAAATGLCPADQLGRPRGPDEACLEFVDLGPAPSGGGLTGRLAGIVELLRYAGPAPTLLVAALVHAEVAVVRPFAVGNGVLARALERLLVTAGGLDPTGAVVPEAGHYREGGPAYLGALTAYAHGGADGVALWLAYCGRAVAAGALEGREIADQVLAGRLG